MPPEAAAAAADATPATKTDDKAAPAASVVVPDKTPADAGTQKPDAAAAAAAAAGKTPEQIAADAAAATAAETARKAETPVSKAPEKYALVIPAGGRVDARDLASIEKNARAAGWSNEEAQAAVAEFDGLIKAQSEQFLTDTKADPTYGGEHLAQTQQLARAVIDRIRPDGHPRRESFMAFLNRGGAGNHIEVASFFADLGKLMGEDSPIGGRSGGASGGQGAQKSLYDHPTSQAVESATKSG